MREAARAGLGLTLLPCYFGDGVPGLRRAQEKPIADARSELWLLTHRDLRRAARIRAVMEFLATRLAGERARIEGRQFALHELTPIPPGIRTRHHAQAGGNARPMVALPR